MNLYILITMVIFLFIGVFAFSKFLFSPICLVILSYLFSLVLVLPNVDTWEVNIDCITVEIILAGLISFVIGYFLSAVFTKKNKKRKVNHEYIYMSKKGKMFIVFFVFLTVILNIYYISQLVGTITLSNFGEMIGIYRKMSAYSEELKTIPSFVSQMGKICSVIFYFVAYIFINNIIYNKSVEKKRKNITYTFSLVTILQIILSLLSGGRYTLITSIIGVITIYTIINAKDKEKIQKSFSPKMYFKIAIIFLLVIILFSGMRTLVGRTNQNDIFTYISAYFGGSVPLLDKYIKINSIEEPEQFGYNTFYPVYRLLNKFGFVSDYRRSNLEFYTSGTLMGNVYTSFFPIYCDFGMFGIVLFLLLEGFIWHKLYNLVYIKNKFDGFSLISSIIYCLHMNSLYLHSYSEVFYSAIFSQTFILEIIYTILVYFIIFKLGLRRKE